jgi:hypothetical protein
LKNFCAGVSPGAFVSGAERQLTNSGMIEEEKVEQRRQRVKEDDLCLRFNLAGQ